MKRHPPKLKPGQDPDYLAFVRRLPCCLCLPLWWKNATEAVIIGFLLRHPQPRYFGGIIQKSLTEAAHVGKSTSRRGMGQKFPDTEAIPLCGIEHHREGWESHHKLGKNFWTIHERLAQNRDGLIELLNRAYDLWQHDANTTSKTTAKGSSSMSGHSS